MATTPPLPPPLQTLPTEAPRRSRSGERLRWGMTGLAAIFLLVMVAAASLRPAGGGTRHGAGEPLAVLGVAPGPASRPAPDDQPQP